MKPTVQEKLDKIFNYPFFQAIGSELPESVTPVPNWHLSVQACTKDRKWETCRLMARNALQRFTEERDWKRADEWNLVTDELRPLIVAFVDTLVGRPPVPKEAGMKIKGDISWDIMLICLETEYSDLVEPLFYLPLLDPWYAAGHFPCGWDGEEFPDCWDGVIRAGRLMVF